MNWTQTKPAPLIDASSIRTHLRIDDDSQDAYLTTLIVAATAHAEQAMGASLLTRNVSASFSAGETLYLPRGPISSVSSVSLGATPLPSGAYGIDRYGNTEVLRYQGGNTAPAPVTVQYVAGYGPTLDDVPADIVQVIKCYVGLLYEQRETATDRTVTPVPFIEDFLRLHSRECGVG